jgi:uncharacterized protein YjiS (DUF1127 family)
MIALANAYQPGRAGAERRGDEGLLETLKVSVRNYMAYLEARAALEAMSVRELDDIGLAGADLKAVARRAAYGA